MKLIIENLGVIRHAEFDLDKQLTIFCGRNNTGKTYASFILQAFLSDDLFPFSGFDSIKKQIRESDSFTISKKIVEDWLNEHCQSVRSQLGVIMGISEETCKKLFDKAEISVDYTDEDYARSLDVQFDLQWKTASHVITLHKKKGDENITIESSLGIDKVFDTPYGMWTTILCNALHNIAFANRGNATMLTVERNSIYTFKTELSISRNELIDRIQQNSEKKEIDVIDLINSSSRRYPSAISKSLRIANDLATVQKRNSVFADVANTIESDLLAGEVVVNKDGDVEFHVHNMPKNRRLPFHLSSSIVKTMASFVVYLRHLARPGDTLIIDEPEMNFHPDVQIELTHIFAKLVNRGLRIVISTHSDYIVREFNNLIMAYNIAEGDKEATLREVGYDTGMLLSHRDVAVYVFERKKKLVEVQVAPIDKSGVSISSIDETINRQNERAEILYASLGE